MTRLSVNVNKFATLRNARGGNNPNLVQVVKDCERFGAQGITVHPRPDERHIRYQDVFDIRPLVKTEFNMEGYPDKRFIEMVLKAKPEQVTLVPDPPDVLTSNNGWNTRENKSLLQEVVGPFREAGIRCSIFLNPDPEMAFHARDTGTHRVELYTESYAKNYHNGPEEALKPYLETALAAGEAGLELNAGHDLDLHNLKYFKQHIPGLKEVSIGHALVCDALYYGLENTIQQYLRQLL